MTEETRADDSWLWDRSGDPDPQLREWETLLSEVRTAAPLPAPPRFEPVARWRREHLALAASLVLAAAAGVLWYALGDTGVSVDTVTGTPTLSGQLVVERTPVVPGAVVETGAEAEARLRIGRIGWVRVRTDTVVQVLAAQTDAYRLSIRRGAVRADISADPGVFVVDTPFATAIDMGCVYELIVDTSGGGSLTVESGWVAFESPGRQALVPEGGRALSRGAAGVGSPYYLDASPAFAAALAIVDFPPDADAVRRTGALAEVLAQAREKDAITLLTLLRRVDAAGRLLVHDRLRVLLPPPAGVTRTGIGAGDLAMIDRWWEALEIEFDKKPPVARSPG